MSNTNTNTNVTTRLIELVNRISVTGGVAESYAELELCELRKELLKLIPVDEIRSSARVIVSYKWGDSGWAESIVDIVRPEGVDTFSNYDDVVAALKKTEWANTYYSTDVWVPLVQWTSDDGSRHEVHFDDSTPGAVIEGRPIAGWSKPDLYDGKTRRARKLSLKGAYDENKE